MILTMGASFGQESAAQIAARQEAAERERLMQSALEQAREDNVRMQRQLNQFANENSALQRQIAELERKFNAAQAAAISRKDLEKIVEQIRKVDDNRIADKNLILEQIKEVAKIASKPSTPIVIERDPVVPPTRNRDRESVTPLPDKNGGKHEEETAVLDNPDGYYTYEVKSGDSLSAVIRAYNDKLKDQNKAAITLDQVKKANPGLKPERMIVGKKIQIPIPPDKK